MPRGRFPTSDLPMKIYSFVERYVQKNGQSPTQMEIAVQFDRGQKTIEGHLKRLEKDGYITLGGRRGIRIL